MNNYENLEKRELIELLISKIKNLNNNQNQEIAIIGLSGRYPESGGIDEFWQNLHEGKNCIKEVPADRWCYQDYFSSDRREENMVYSKWGGFINDYDKFEPLFFNISPKEAERMDPQERLFLEEAWHAIEDAGYARKDIQSRYPKTGVFVGVMNNDYEFLAGEKWAFTKEVKAYSAYWSIANRVSYFFNFQGPSMVVDTACASSLTAIYLACESIKRGDCRVAIAGGVNLILHPKHFVTLSSMQMLTESNQLKSFGVGANGFIDGEGVGAVVLKPLDRAIIDRDNIYAVVKGAAINAGGKTHGYTVPNPNAQAELIQAAIKRSGVNPRTISYIEAHGTGTELGDPIEIRGLSKAFSKYTEDENFCAIGSVKSNIGHLESASGMASLTKVLLQMKYEKLVPSLHSAVINPKIDFKNSPFYIQKNLAKWDQPVIKIAGNKQQYPRRAGISNFGAGGANVHLILEEYKPNNNKGEIIINNGLYMIALSAKKDVQLKAYAVKLKEFIESRQELEKERDFGDSFKLHDMSYTLLVGREPMNTRLFLLVKDKDDLISKLEIYISGKDAKGIMKGDINGSSEIDNQIYKSQHQNLITELRVQGINLNDNLKIESLGKLWLNGFDFDWGLLFKDKELYRISLPTYPYEKKRYWIEAETPEPPTARNALQYTNNKEINNDSLLLRENKMTSEKKINQADIIVIIRRVLKLEQSEINLTRTLSDYGIDSINLLKIIDEIKKTFGVNDIKLPNEFYSLTLIEFVDQLIQNSIINDDDRSLNSIVQKNIALNKEQVKKYDVEAMSYGEDDIGIVSINKKNKLFDFFSNYSTNREKNKANTFEIDYKDKTYIDYLLDYEKDLLDLIVKTSLGKIEVITVGKGIPIVLMPGLNLIAPIWINQIKEWSINHQVIVIHYPGHGYSDPMKDDFDFNLYSVIFKDVLKALGISRPAHFVSVCGGGYFAQYIAKNYSEIIASLTLVGSFTKINLSMEYAASLSEFFKKDFDMVFQLIIKRNKYLSIDYFSEWFFYRCFAKMALEPELLALFDKDYPSTVNFLVDLDIPVLLLVGENEHKTLFFNPNESIKIHKKIKKSIYKEILYSGHFPMLHNPKDFNKTVMRFIMQNEKKYCVKKDVPTNLLRKLDYKIFNVR